MRRLISKESPARDIEAHFNESLYHYFSIAKL